MGYITFKTVICARNLVAILIILGFIGPVIKTSFALAQGTTAITPTMGVGSLGTTVTMNGNTVQITGGTNSDNGQNLFHSFGQFSVGEGDTAQFLNSTPSLTTSNILSRVTGGNPSSIFGTIDTMSYPRASLFLMNPAGIIFGPNATLNVGGSVAFTTADYLRLANTNGSNTGIFRADTTALSLLTSAPVTAFGFLGSNPALIAVQGSTLTVQTGQAISLVGGNITVESSFLANSADLPAPSTPGKQVYLASVASPGEVLVETLAPAANIIGHSFEALGTVKISQGSNTDTSGRGGTIRIRGGRLIIDDSIIFANTGDISLDGTSVHITNGALIATETLTADNAGHITMKALGDIDIDSSGEVGSFSTNSSGLSGKITFSSSQGNISLTKATVFQDANGSGNTGNITIYAPHGNISLTGESNITSRATGTGTLGDIQIQANDLYLRDASKIGGDNTGTSTQVPGNISITLDGQLSLASGSFINTEAFSTANSADLIISASEVLISGKDKFHSGLYTDTISSGDGGRLNLFTDNLQLKDGGILSSKSFIGFEGKIPSGRGGDISIEGYKTPSTSITIDGPGSGIFTSAEGTGAAGNIEVKATSVTLQNGGRMSAETTGTSSNATGGSIIVNATDQVTLTNDASITASSTGPADAGNISINAGQQLNMENSKITTEANQSKAGNINLQAIDQVRVVNGEISTSVHSGAGRGGDITIDPKTVILQDGTKVFAQAVQGSGGNITITTPLYLIDSTSRVNADSQFGLNGSVTIQSPTSNLSGTVGQLASKTSPPQVLLQNRCVALAGGEQSTFILAGRDALPSEPGGWLSSPVAMEHWTGEGMEEHASGLMVRRVGPRESSEVLSLRQLTPPGFLVRSFAESALTGCRT